MKKVIRVIVLLTAVFFLVGAGTVAVAYDENDHVIVAPNSNGDVVVFPVVIGLDGGWVTKIVVTNTSTYRSAVAKVIFRDGLFSQELLDFLIYLSPTDVWWGEISYGPNGVRVYSTDGSGPSSTAGQTWASETYPLDQPFVPVACAPGAEQIVYCEVIGAWSDVIYIDDKRLLPPISKDIVKAAYDDEDDDDWGCSNILTGHYELTIAGVTTGANNALVLAGYENEGKLSPMNPTILGEKADNNLCEIGAALSKRKIGMPYYNGLGKLAIHWHTFITKLSTIDSLCEIQGVEGPFFNPENEWMTDDFKVIFSPLYFDLEENAPGREETPFSPYTPPPDRLFPYEVNFLFTVPDFISANYQEGWVRYEVDAETSCAPETGYPEILNYDDSPDIPTVWFFGPAGLSILDPHFRNGHVDYWGWDNYYSQWMWRCLRSYQNAEFDFFDN